MTKKMDDYQKKFDAYMSISDEDIKRANKLEKQLKKEKVAYCEHRESDAYHVTGGRKIPFVLVVCDECFDHQLEKYNGAKLTKKNHLEVYMSFIGQLPMKYFHYKTNPITMLAEKGDCTDMIKLIGLSGVLFASDKVKQK